MCLAFSSLSRCEMVYVKKKKNCPKFLYTLVLGFLIWLFALGKKEDLHGLIHTKVISDSNHISMWVLWFLFGSFMTLPCGLWKEGGEQAWIVAWGCCGEACMWCTTHPIDQNPVTQPCWNSVRTGMKWSCMPRKRSFQQD